MKEKMEIQLNTIKGGKIVHTFYDSLENCKKDNKGNWLIDKNLPDNSRHVYVIFMRSGKELFSCMPYSTFKILRHTDFTIGDEIYDIAIY